MSINSSPENNDGLVPNENYKYFESRLANAYLISSKIYMTKSVYQAMMAGYLSTGYILNALAENQFSTGGMNRINIFLNSANSTKNSSEQKINNNFKSLLKSWLSTIDIDRVVIS